MTTTVKTLALALATGFAAMPLVAAAQTTDPTTMTCAEFTALDDAGKTAAVMALHAAGPNAATPMDEAGTTAASTALTSACEATPEATAMEVMATVAQ